MTIKDTVIPSTTQVDNNTIENDSTVGLKIKPYAKFYSANSHTITGLQGKKHYKGTLTFRGTGSNSAANLNSTKLNSTGFNRKCGLYASNTTTTAAEMPKGL